VRLPRIERAGGLGVRGPRSLQARTALAAGLAALVLFGAGAWEMGRVAYGQRMSQTRLEAQDEAGDILDSMTLSVWPGGDDVGQLPYEIDTTGGLVASSSGLTPFEPNRQAFMPLPGTGGSDSPFWGSTVAGFPEVGGKPDSGLAGATLTVETATLPVSLLARGGGTMTMFDTATGSPPNSMVRVYVFATTQFARQAQTALDRDVYPAVPAVALLVAAVAFLATRRALRPVEEIRVRTAAVTATDPRERVAVPRTGDEIARLAVTINETLERLESASRTQRRFVADAAHELRSPLASLLATLEVAEVYPDRADWPETVAVATRQARRVQALADDLLLLARLDSAPIPTRDRPVDLAALAQDVATDFGTRCPVGVRDETDGGALVHGVPLRLERMLRNLVDNATRFAKAEVQIEVSVQGAQVVLTVHDDGPGIPAEDRERVFERFTRLDDDRSRDTGGSGLGLAIVREIAERHRGTVRVQAADAADPGARVTVRLPLAD
jgi:signal transduction histidine kinase